MDTKILLANYPSIIQNVKFEEIKTKRRLEVVVGYDINVDSKVITMQIARDLITSLLTYDKIYVEGYSITDIIQVWGSDYVKELLRLGIIKIIPDQTLNPAIIQENNSCRIDFFPYAQNSVKVGEYPSEVFDVHKWSHIENNFQNKGFVGQEANMILYLVDENSVTLDESEIVKRVNKETTIDVSNTSLLTKYGLVDPNMRKPLVTDYPKLLRIQELNKVGVLASTLGIESIKTDGEIGTLLALKSLSEFNKEHYNGIDALNKVAYEKGFPDLGELFVNKIIDLDAILKLRESFQSKIFRYWLQQTKYEEKLMRKEIMNSVHNVLGSKISNVIRMMACNFIGIGGFVPGVIASSLDSFILDKVVHGWHPNFFLDDKLKFMIDKCITDKDLERKKELIKYRFKGVGYNDFCPCGSGIKFKKCHGKMF